MTRSGTLKNSLTLVGACVVLACAWGCDSQAPAAGAVAAQTRGPQIYLKLDFDSGENPFSSAQLLDDPAQALSGRSLYARATAGQSVGAQSTIKVSGSQDLKVAFSLRAKAMKYVTVNMFDQRRGDNTTPASPARVFDEEWHPVVFGVEDFHYNADPPDRKIAAENDFASLLFHGAQDGSAEVWIDKLVIYRGHDALPPGAPTDLRAVAGSNGVELRWQEPSDDTFAVVYSVFRKTGAGAWQKIGESLRPSYRDSSAPPDTHAYRVTAADYENNVSTPSSDATITTTTPAGAVPAPTSVGVDRAGYRDNVRQVHAKGSGRVRPDVFLFAGDSITAATVYTHILGGWLARGLTVRQGVGRVTTEFGAEMINQYLTSARPEFAVALYGTNDTEDRVSTSESMRNLTAVIDACFAFGTVPVLTTIPPRGYDKRRQGDQERFNKALVELAKKKQVPVSYAFEEMMTHDLNDMTFDGVHLTPEAGNEAAGRALRRTMDQVYFALRDTSGTW